MLQASSYELQKRANTPDWTCKISTIRQNKPSKTVKHVYILVTIGYPYFFIISFAMESRDYYTCILACDCICVSVVQGRLVGTDKHSLIITQEMHMIIYIM